MFAYEFEKHSAAAKRAKVPMSLITHYLPAMLAGGAGGALTGEDPVTDGLAGAAAGALGTYGGRRAGKGFDYLRYKANWVPKHKATEWIADMSPQTATGVKNALTATGGMLGPVVAVGLNRWRKKHKGDKDVRS